MIVPATTPGEKLTLLAYLASKMRLTPDALVGQMPFEIMAVTRDGLPRGAVLYTNFRNTSIEMACAGEPGWLSRGDLRCLFSYPFNQLGVFNVLTMVDRTNYTARDFNKKLGMTELCMIESGKGKEFDTILYGMSKNKCRWIAQAPQLVTQAMQAEMNGAYAHGR